MNDLLTCFLYLFFFSFIAAFVVSVVLVAKMWVDIFAFKRRHARHFLNINEAAQSFLKTNDGQRILKRLRQISTLGIKIVIFMIVFVIGILSVIYFLKII